MMSLLEIKNINMNYHRKDGVTEALKNINFTVEREEFISIIGPSGCGKSTLLNIISGLLTPSSGEVIYNDPEVKNNLDKMGYMFQKDFLFPWLTVKENVMLGLKLKKVYTKENIEFAHQLLKPEVLLLDEPFSALDYQSRLNVTDDVYEIIKREKKTAIMVTHDLGEAITMSNRVIILSSRPATIKKDVKIVFERDELKPFDKREEKEYNKYFKELWGELEDANE